MGNLKEVTSGTQAWSEQEKKKKKKKDNVSED